MKLLFKQRNFSWFDSYDIYDENGNTLFVVKGEFAFGKLLRIYDPNGNPLGYIQRKVFSLLPRFDMYEGDRYSGCITKDFSFFVPRFSIDYNGWRVQGQLFEWEYEIVDASGQTVACISKQLFNLTDTYVIDVINERDALNSLMLVLAIDAEKAARNN